MTYWVATTALTKGPLRTRPYHDEGKVRQHDGVRLLMTLCGCAIQWGDEPPVMVEVAPIVARLVARPCKDCARRRTYALLHGER